MKPATHFETASNLAHVSIGMLSPNGRRIVLVLPTNNLRAVTCFLTDVTTNESRPLRQTSVGVSGFSYVHHFDFANLVDGHLYEYEFAYEDGSAIELGGGLTESDLHFTYWSDATAGQGQMMHLSCNGVLNADKHVEPFDMWVRAERELLGKIKVISHGGDQYYQDEMENEWLSKLGEGVSEETLQKCFESSLNNALKYLCHLSYRKLVASTVSLAMMDDHDITDGAGGRIEYYKKKGQLKNWENFKTIQLKVFKVLQALRNPNPLIKKDLSSFSFVANLGPSLDYLALDMRSEKDHTVKKLMDDDHKTAVLKYLSEVESKMVMISLPVVPFRNNLQKDEGFRIISNIAQGLSFVTKNEHFKKLFEAVGSVNDDVNDSLSSPDNEYFLAELLEAMVKAHQRGVKFALLSGDIHTGGTTELYIKSGSTEFHVPLIISSPIGYKPMPSVVGALIAEKREIKFTHKDIVVTGVNNFYSHNRNFMVVDLNRLLGGEQSAVYIYQEGITGRKALMTHSWEQEKVIEKSKTKTAAKRPEGEV